MRVAALEKQVALGACDKERSRESEAVKALEIDVGTIHYIEGPGLQLNLVEHIDVMHLAVGNMDKCRDIALQVEQRVHLDRGLMLTEAGPGKQGKTEIDGGRVQSVETVVQLHSLGVGGIQGSRDANEKLGKVGKDAPVMGLVGIGKSGTGNLATKAEMIALGAKSAEACFDVAQALAVGQLREGHGQILFPAGQPTQASVALIPRHAAAKLAVRKERNELCKDRAPLVHAPSSTVQDHAPK